ncbi:MAG TPA: PepSY-associated TM helix domain-containing protein [Opitutaceae bacterium]|nr:PepSY-associated TM helix domain-containing protein [Opitutaceae bacterium]
MKRTLRKTIFWVHLVIGLAAGLVIAVVALTGAAMAFQPQILEWAERDVRQVTPLKSARLPVDTLLERVREQNPDAQPFSVTLSSDPSAAAVVSLGRAGSLYVDPYTGDVKPSGAKNLREFFSLMLRLHRWLSVSSPNRTIASPTSSGETPPSAPTEPSGTSWREIGSSIVGIATILFLALSVSGIYLWWPRNWNWRTLKTTSALNFKLRGKARDWNWHNVIGLWSTPVLAILCLTGIVMAYRPVGNWIYQRPQGQSAGSLPPGVELPKPAVGARPLNRETLFTAAMTAVPNWETITLRTGQNRQRGGGASGPGRSAAPHVASFSVRETGSWAPVPVQVSVDPYTGAILHKEGFSDYGFRRALRAMNLSLHMGTAGGIVGQTIAFLACVGGLFLVYTGFALSWRRFFGRRRPLPSPIKETRVISTTLVKPAAFPLGEKTAPPSVKSAAAN